MPTNIQSEWFRGPSADLGTPIDQSLRFINGNDTDLDRSQAAGNRQQFTFSAWLKRGSLGMRGIFSGGTNGQPFILRFDTDDSLRFYEYSSSFETDLRGNDLFRDTSAWYHIVFVYDTPNATSADRIRIYVNGRRITDFSTATYPSQNRNGYINYNNSQFHVGNYPDSTTQHFDGYMAEVNFLDGYVVSETNGVPDEFGRYNDDGVWVPKSVSDLTAANYGVNGLRLTFASDQHATASTAIGIDSAPTGTGHASANNLTANNFETTAISSSNFDNDIDYEDTPTSNYATLNAVTASDKTLSGANLTFSAGGSGPWWGASSTLGVSSGKWYWEAEAVGTETFLGIIRDGANPNVNAYPGQSSSPGSATHSANSWGLYDNNGSIYHNSSPYSYGSSWSAGDIIGIAMDLENNAFWVSKNGTWYNSATQSEVEAGTTTNAAATNLTGTNFRAVFHGADSSSNGWNVNLGQRDFVYTKPSGFEALDSSKMPEPTIKNGKEHFDVVTYTGDGTSGRDIAGLDFQPDLVWLKGTNLAYNHRLYDSVRGINKSLISNLADGEYTTADSLTAFNADGFQIGTGNSYNTNGSTYVGWCWKAGGTAVSNTDGTITSSVSANTDAGFSIVSFTGNTSSSQTIGHGLNSAPEFIIIKNRIDNANWYVYHEGLTTPNNQYLVLNESDGAASAGGANGAWNNTSPTSSVFHVGNTYGSTNGNGDGMIAYCWHSVEGFSKFGSYTGNANADGPFIYTGHRSAFILIKETTATGNSWVIFDAARSENNPAPESLFPNNSNTESTSGNEIDILSNGFKIRNSNNTTNRSGQTYVYASFAENPFGGENQPPATAR